MGVGFGGDIKSAWMELTNGEDRNATLVDLDPHSDVLLRRFMQTLKNHSDNPQETWFGLMRDQGVNGRMSLSQFQMLCKDMDFSERETKLLFNCLDNGQHHARGRITMEDWTFLKLWDGRASPLDSPRSNSVVSFRSSSLPVRRPVVKKDRAESVRSGVLEKHMAGKEADDVA